MAAKTKIVLISDTHHLKDDRIYWKQAMSLLKAGFEVHHIYVRLNGENKTGITKEGIHYFQIKRLQYFSNVVGNYLYKKILPVNNEFKQMLVYLNQLQPNIIQFCDYKSLQLIPAVKKLQSKPKLVYDIHENNRNNLLTMRMKNWKLPQALKVAYANYIQHWEYKKANKGDYIITTNEFNRDIAKKYAPNTPVETIYNFTNLETTRTNIPYNQRQFDAIYTGGISTLRGAKVIAKATKLVKEQLPNCKVLLLGNFSEPNLKNWLINYSSTHQLQNNLLLKEFVPYDEIATYYNNTKIGLNPLLHITAHETILQIKLFEYMNYGLPIISSNFGKMNKFVLDNKVGKTIPPNDETALANAILHLLNHPKEMEEYGNNGIQAVDQQYNWNVMEEKYLNIIHSLFTN